MGDRISSLPDAVLCYILSFLPTKVAVATSVLSKRWKPLWRSVPALDFDEKTDYSGFVQSVNAFILSRDTDVALKRFRIRCDRHSLGDNAWLILAAQRRLEHLDLSLYESIPLLSPLLTSKTLALLNFTNLRLEALSSVHLPSLKTLHLNRVTFSQRRHLADFLSGTPNLEDLEINYLSFSSYQGKGNFKRLPKLRRAVIIQNAIPLDVVYNVHFLRIDNTINGDPEEVIPEFHNLTHIEFGYLDFTNYWFDVFKVIKHCPKLQNLNIDQEYPEFDEEWPCPPCVPVCISLHLKTCRFNKYTGTEGEFKFAKYIMENARVLERMTICFFTLEHQHEKQLEMILKLSLCTILSSTCKLLFNF